MAKDFVHNGTRSWWNGSFTTLCGEVWPAAVVKRSRRKLFGPSTCPGCVAAEQAGKAR